MGEDGELLLAYSRRGDVESLAALVRRHSVWMQAFLSGMLPSGCVEDAFQETWLKVIRSAASYRGGKVRPYLVSVARSVAVDRLRRERSTVSLDAGEGEGASLAAEAAADGPSPGDAFELKAASEDIRRAVRALPEGPRQVLLMRIEGELSFKEIASVLGVPLGTALTWMRTATVRLKKMLGGER